MKTCNECNAEHEQASADNPNKGMIWLCPDEKWICQRCFKAISRGIIHG